jgi:uncharacterized RDD family membrane protein YckC
MQSHTRAPGLALHLIPGGTGHVAQLLRRDPAGCEAMQEEFSLDTPEAISVSYTVAGIGTRFLAAAIDLLTIYGIGVVALVGVLLLAQLGGFGQTAAVIIVIVLVFVLFWCYYIVYEALWSGQTPGKRAMHIRVIKTSGYPIGGIESLIRNVVRGVDYLPSLYLIGLIVMFISTESRRLGDYAAGTIVVKERASTTLADLGPTTIATAGGPQEQVELTPEEEAWTLRALTGRDLSVIREYLARAPSLPAPVRERIGADIATRVAARIGAEPGPDPTMFLRRVLALGEVEGRRR